MTYPQRERGMILINVLVIIMLATAVLAIMLAGEDDELSRAQSQRDAAAAMAVARGAELTAVAALRRDLASGSLTDTLDEKWANIADNNVRIPGGRFSFVVADAQARFNINNAGRGDVLSLDALAQVGQALGIDQARLPPIAAFLKAQGAVEDLSVLRGAGLSEADLARLATYCTALPTPTTVNINTAPEPLLALITGNPATAHQMVEMRARGRLAAAGAQIFLPPGTGQASDYFWARARVTIGGTTQQLTTLLHRRRSESGVIVEAVRRWMGIAPPGAPALPA